MRSKSAVVLILAMSTFAAAQTAGDVLGRIQKKYEGMKNVCADYSQTFHWELANETQVFEGHLCTRNGVQFKIENNDQTIITDGKTIWTMPHGNNQVIIDDASESDGDNPFLKSFLQNYIDNYKSELLPPETIAGAVHYHIRLTARSEDEFNKEVEIWADQKSLLMNRIKQTDQDGNSSTYEVRDVDLNANLSDASFKPVIPEGYEIVDMR
ncbi:MAG TPA: outer membrane lipoprotein carrier protein LolA [bacterium]|nr:outer membrane lipoprotein carrier protein LolA [bacterium]HPR89673.1 outer membrane lipoprotein carrier protein LolA [bacterium]